DACTLLAPAAGDTIISLCF
nr:Chain C, Hypoxia-inducible factor 1-alpha [Homo sapiens]5L9V_D Chain D, Hypoxia-inducible factor 1-alpha [Homo sapiens]5LA9_C Chain C, Hypoxia-inducible factor 1-alpha [Homo sapiens]5LA9_D Chain D, Hypoxia-inducible factor 1-alpha [Homo sapiens]5LAS_C Chain C, Hypoxia-inducible factor 1-alpha [Homo sapiens]5LAS_D Chain D, Hypoxia-inducible factor 1-alpha [Homo sapiens]